MQCRILKYNPQNNVPTYHTFGSAGADLEANEHVVIEPGKRALVSTGITLAIPNGYVGMVCSRSGLALHNGVFVLNAPGIIDSDYRGEVKVILQNADNKNTYVVNVGDRIAQLVIVPITQAEFVVSLDDTNSQTTRGTSGFGSTGI